MEEFIVMSLDARRSSSSGANLVRQAGTQFSRATGPYQNPNPNSFVNLNSNLPFTTPSFINPPFHLHILVKIMRKV